MNTHVNLKRINEMFADFGLGTEEERESMRKLEFIGTPSSFGLVSFDSVNNSFSEAEEPQDAKLA